jgi:DNA-binding CsgD family transcriptional regulator
MSEVTDETLRRAFPKDKLSILTRRKKILALARQGLDNPREIAERLGVDYEVSKWSIRNDIQRIRKSWKRVVLREIKTHQAEEVAKVNEVERVAWEAYNRSLMLDENGIPTSQGNTRHLEIILKCVEKRCFIMGIGDKKLQESVANANKSEVTIDQFVAQAALKSKQYRIQRTEIIVDNEENMSKNPPKVIENLEISDNPPKNEDYAIWEDVKDEDGKQTLEQEEVWED